jgi:hypothetical protein
MRTCSPGSKRSVTPWVMKSTTTPAGQQRPSLLLLQEPMDRTEQWCVGRFESKKGKQEDDVAAGPGVRVGVGHFLGGPS